MRKTMFVLVGLTAFVTLLPGPALAQRLIESRVESGSLGPGDRRNSDGQLYDEYVIGLAAGQRVRINASRGSGSELDPIVEVYRSGSSTRLGYDDDSGGYPNARLDFTAPGAGNYAVRVRNFSSTTGAYNLRIDPLSSSGGGGGGGGGGSGGGGAGTGGGTGAGSTTALQAVNSGRFDTSVPRLDGGQGSHYRDYRVTLAAGEFVVLRMEAAAFDAYLYVYRAGEEAGQPLASNDDFGSLDSAILFRAPSAGTYTVRASQLGHADGPYTLRMDRLR